MIDPLKRSAASKAMHAKIPPAVRSKRASALAKAKWAKITPEDRRKYAMKLVAARMVDKN